MHLFSIISLVMLVVQGFPLLAGAVNPPEAFDDFYTTKIDTSVEVFLSASDLDGDPLTYNVTGGPANGSLDDCTDGVCTYTPDSGFTGTDSFTFTASDGTDTSNEATVTIEVNPNSVPVASDSSFSTKVDVPVEVSLSAFDDDFDPLTYNVTGGPSNGSLDDCTSGSCTYTPDGGFLGTDSFTFTASDGIDTSNEATVTIEVNPNSAPEAFDGSFTTKVNAPVDINLAASDVDGDPLTYTVTSAPVNGSVDDCSSGFCVYTPNNGFTETDSFTFTASDGEATSNEATVTIDVLDSSLRATPLSSSLTPSDLAEALAGEGVTITNVTFTGNEIAAGLFLGGAAPIGIDAGVVLSSGRAVDVAGPNLDDGWTTDLGVPGDSDLSALAGVTTNDATILEFDLVPDTDQLVFQYVFGSDEYNEFVNSPFNDVFAFFVNGVNCALVNGQPVSINTVNNGNPYDSDPRSNPEFFINNDLNDGGGLLVTELDGLTVVLTCVASVTPDVSNSIKLAIADGSDSILDSAVFLAQGSFQANSAPTADDISVTTTEDTPVNVQLTGSDPENDPLTFSVTGGPANGTLSGTEPNLIYTPDLGFTGTDTFTYIANDGVLDSLPATVTITVESADVNSSPVVDAGGDVSGVEGSAVGLSGSASDPDSDPLVLSWSYVPGVGVDAGATCVFSDPNAAVTSITCTDDGVFTVTLTADDGVNPVVEDSATVTLSNADPVVDITSPSDGAEFGVGATVDVSASFTDAGGNDTHTCSIDWGDGTVEAGTVANGDCTGSHGYGSVAVPTLIVTVTDDDAGVGTDEIMLIVTSKTAKVTGGGFFFDGSGTTVTFGLVAERSSVDMAGQIQVRIHNSHRFHGTDVDSITSSGNTAVWSGPGLWDGVSGYRYEVSVEDRGNGKSKKGAPDHIAITIWDSLGNVVYSSSSSLGGGNIKVH